MTNLLEDGMEWIADRLGESASQSVTYRDRYGVETSLSAALGVETTQLDNAGDIACIVRQRTCSITNPISTVDTSGTVFIGTVEWAIVSIEVRHDEFVVATCERRELLEQGRPNLRRR